MERNEIERQSSNNLEVGFEYRKSLAAEMYEKDGYRLD